MLLIAMLLLFECEEVVLRDESNDKDMTESCTSMCAFSNPYLEIMLHAVV